MEMLIIADFMASTPPTPANSVQPRNPMSRFTKRYSHLVPSKSVDYLSIDPDYAVAKSKHSRGDGALVHNNLQI